MEGRGDGSGGFFPMKRGDGIFVLVFVTLSATGFALPVLREGRLLGLALFGWWMAGLMILVPAVALYRVLRERPAGAEGEAGDEGCAP